jgi:multidrug efflux system membrane fusion protein
MKRFLLLTQLALTLFSCSKKTAPPEKPAPLVRVESVQSVDTPLFNTYVGHVVPYMQIDVRAQVEGELTGYYFIEGQEVKEGDLIFTLDARPYEAQLAKAKAALANTMATLQFAKETAERNKELAKEEFVAILQYDEYLTNVETAKANIEGAKADIDTAKINISYCNIHSPISGVTGKLEFDVGNLITNAGQTPLVTINQVAPIYVYFSVPQSDLPSIMKRQRLSPLLVETFLNDDLQTPFTGTLDFIDNQIDPQTGSIWMRGVFANESRLLWPGEFTEVRLILEVQTGALLIPTQAIQVGPKGLSVFVLKEDAAVELRTVTVGQRVNDKTIIKAGLKEGEKVVVEGQINLSPGIKVTVS